MQTKVRTIKDETEKLGFGLYKNKTVYEVMKSDPHYLKWMHTNTKIHLSKQLWKQFIEKNPDLLK